MKRMVMMTALACFTLPTWTAAADSNDVDRQILGAWKLQFTTPDGEQRTPTVVVGRQNRKYVAWYVRDDQVEPFRNVQLQDDTLVGTISPRERPDITVTITSRLIADNRCAGTAKYRSKDGAEEGSWELTGQRIALSTFDEVMTWKLQFVTPDDQQHAPTVTVVTKDGAWFAWYSDKNHELPASKISVVGNRVEMKMSAESPDGLQVDVIFRGTLDGDQVQGNAEFRTAGDTGSFPFTGKRAS